eukprot:11701730-Prorocentrum_lima.AAC.1
MTSSLVGSEMCIRDSPRMMLSMTNGCNETLTTTDIANTSPNAPINKDAVCLLYTSDAADDM